MPKGAYVRAQHEFDRLRRDNERRRPGGDLHADASAIGRANILSLRVRWLNERPDEPLQRASGIASSAINYRCHGCQRVIRGPAFFKHQKASDHTGFTIINQENHEDPS